MIPSLASVLLIWIWIVARERYIVTGVVAVAAIAASFFFGFYSGASQREGPPVTVVRAAALPVVQHDGEGKSTPAATLTARDCVFVGSAKVTKYYPPTCAYAKNIEKKNLRCFRSEKQAQEEGYTRSQSC